MWDLNIGGGYSSEGKDEGAMTYVYGGLDFNYKLLPNLKAKIEPRFRVYEGRVQARYDDDLMSNGFGAQNAYLSYEPIPYIELRGGAQSQREVRSPMLVSNYRAFTGAKEIFKFDTNGVSYAAVFQQVIPSSQSLNTEREDKEPLPWFKTEALDLKGKTEWLEWRATGGLFQWESMPSKVVAESGQVGNLVNGDLVPGATLQFEHKGWFASADGCFCNLGLVGILVEYQRISNTAAPSSVADAQLWGIGPRFTWNDMELDLRYRQFFIESEATVAIYNKSRFGHTNRMGDNLEAELRFKKLGFSLYAEGYRVNPITKTYHPNQFDMQEFYLGVETDYASF